MFVLEVYVRRDRKEGTRKQEQADTCRSATEGQGTALLLGQGGVRLWPILGLWFPSASNIQTKPLGKKGTFLDTGRQRVNPNKEEKKQKIPVGHKILPLSWT